MNALIDPCELFGSIQAIPSKSEAHRMLICAALSDAPTRILCRSTSEDIEATIGCLESLGARFERSEDALVVHPIERANARAARLDCRESGSTLRFLLPVAAALGGGTFKGAGRLAQRPLDPLIETLRGHGVTVAYDGKFPLTVSGGLKPGAFRLPGNISSQFVTGVLLAAPLLGGEVDVVVTEPVESRPYIALTLQILSAFGVATEIIHDEGLTCYRIRSGAKYTSPGTMEVSGDWSNSSFWLAAGALSQHGICVEGIEPASKQADRAVMGALALFGAHVARSNHAVAARLTELNAATMDVTSCPDLVPAIAPVAALSAGTSAICGAGRLRLKESDRMESIAAAINAIGGRVAIEGDALIFEGVGSFSGGVVDAANDHRIAMMAAICAARSDAPIIIRGAECVAKSYPGFFEDFESLGGTVKWEV